MCVVSRVAHRLQHIRGRGRRVEADAVRDAAVLVRIVGEHDRHALLRVRLLAQLCPTRRKLGDICDAVGLRPVAHRPALGERIEFTRLLERDCARDDPPVDLRQHNVHREVGRREPARRMRPRLFRDPRKGHLDHRALAAVEHRARELRARLRQREGGGVQDDGGFMLRKCVGDERRVLLRLQARHEDRQRVQTPLRERLAKRIDGLRLPACISAR